MLNKGLFTTDPYYFDEKEPKEFVVKHKISSNLFGQAKKSKFEENNPEYLEYRKRKEESETNSYNYKINWFRELTDSQVDEICIYLEDSANKLLSLKETFNKPKTYANKIEKSCHVVLEVTSKDNRHIYFNSRSVILDYDSQSVYSLLNYTYPAKYNSIVRDEDYDWSRISSDFEETVFLLREKLALAYYSISNAEVNVRDKNILNHISQQNINTLEKIENINILTTNAVSNLVFMCSEIYERLSSDERSKVESIIEKHVPRMVSLLKDAEKMQDTGFLNEAEESVIRQIDLMNKYILSIDEQGVRSYTARMNQMELNVEEEFGINE